MTDKKYFSSAETAAYLGISRGFLMKLTSAHRIPYSKPCGKKLVFVKADLDAWVNAGKVRTRQEEMAKKMVR